MAWWDGDEIDYDSDWYQENDQGWNGINTGGEQDYIPNDGGWNGVNTPEGDWSNQGGADNFIGDNANTSSWLGDPNVIGGNGAPLNVSAGAQENNWDSNIKSALQNLFTTGTGANFAGKGLAAVMEGVQNKKKQSAMRANASQLDPWGSQRGFYQQQAQSTVTDPFSSPIVKAQVEQLQNAQNIKDAAAGRRSNSLTSSPAVMAEMAKIAQQYQAQMAQQGGANINPSGLSTTLNAGSQADINGYISPLLTALGWNNQKTSNNVDPTRQAALDKFLAGSA